MGAKAVVHGPVNESPTPEPIKVEIVNFADNGGGGSMPETIKIWDGTDTVDVTASGAIKTDGSGVTQPISGTVTVNGTITANVGSGTQPVSGTVAVSNFPASQAVTGTFFQATQPVSIAQQLTSKPYIPSAADILSGGTVVANSVTSTAFLTIPAGRTWRGTISVSCASTTATSTVVNSRIVTAGTGVSPAAGAVLAVAFASGVSGNATGSVTLTDVYVVAPVGNAVTLNLVNSSATTTSGAASATGVLL